MTKRREFLKVLDLKVDKIFNEKRQARKKILKLTYSRLLAQSNANVNSIGNVRRFGKRLNVQEENVLVTRQSQTAYSGSFGTDRLIIKSRPPFLFVHHHGRCRLPSSRYQDALRNKQMPARCRNLEEVVFKLSAKAGLVKKQLSVQFLLWVGFAQPHNSQPVPIRQALVVFVVPEPWSNSTRKHSFHAMQIVH